MPTDPDPRVVRTTVFALLAARATDATICPSEAARALAAADGRADRWRDAMPAVHAAIDTMIATDEIALSWKGRRLKARDGPYRITRP